MYKTRHTYLYVVDELIRFAGFHSLEPKTAVLRTAIHLAVSLRVRTHSLHAIAQTATTLQSLSIEQCLQRYSVKRAKLKNEHFLLQRKPCCRKETARCRKCSFLLKFTTSIRLAKLRKRPRFRAPNMLAQNTI